MQKAKELFDAHNYQQAIDAFSTLNQNTGERNSALLFNLGNCYFKMGKYGYARAYYMKALSIAPRDEDIIYNLAYTDSLLNAGGRGVFSKALSFFSIDEVCWALAASFAFSCVFVVLYIKKRRGLLFSGLFGLLFLFSLSFAVAKMIKERDSAVSLYKNMIKAAPSESSTVLAEIPEGAMLGVKERNNGWVRVYWGDDYVGWVKKDSIMELNL